MEKTSSYTYFGIQSNGMSDRGFVAYEKGIFDPEDIWFQKPDSRSSVNQKKNSVRCCEATSVIVG